MNKFTLGRIISDVTNKNVIFNTPLYKGSIATLTLAQKMTKFDIYSILYAQRSKKLRSHEIRVRKGGMQLYQYMGKIIKMRTSFKDTLSSSYIIRNVVDLSPSRSILKFFLHSSLFIDKHPRYLFF